MLTLKAAGLLDVDAGAIIRPGIVRVEDDRIVGIGGEPEGEILDLGDAILLPGLMDMEVNLLMGGRGENPGLSQVQDDPPTRVLRAVGNARRTLRAGFTTVRNLGLFVKTGGYLLDVALGKAIDQNVERAKFAAGENIRTPKFGYERTAAEAQNIITGAPFNKGDASPLWEDFNTKLGFLLASDRANDAQAAEWKKKAEAALKALRQRLDIVNSEH